MWKMFYTSMSFVQSPLGPSHCSPVVLQRWGRLLLVQMGLGYLLGLVLQVAGELGLGTTDLRKKHSNKNYSTVKHVLSGNTDNWILTVFYPKKVPYILKSYLDNSDPCHGGPACCQDVCSVGVGDVGRGGEGIAGLGVELIADLLNVTPADIIIYFSCSFFCSIPWH